MRRAAPFLFCFAFLLCLPSEAPAVFEELIDFGVPGRPFSGSCTSQGCPEYVWLGTGLYVEAGDYLCLYAEGGVGFAMGMSPTASPDGQIGVPAADHGGYYYVSRELDRYSLIGRVGRPDVSDTTRHRLGEPFRVGSDLEMQSSQSGELYLSVNDSYFSDNSGEWFVSGTVQSWPCELTDDGILEMCEEFGLEPPSECPAPTVTIVEVEVPGPERIVEVEKIVEVDRIVEVEKIVEVEVPGPERIVVVEVPGPEKIVEVQKIVEVEVPAKLTVADALALLRDYPDEVEAARKEWKREDGRQHSEGEDSDSEDHDNRSGLGDGTNPGNGKGRDHAKNKGTANPHHKGD